MSLDLSAEDRKALAKDLAAELDTGRYGSRFVLSKRQLLSIAGGSAGVAGLTALGVDPATAQSAAGQVGTEASPEDVFAFDLEVQGGAEFNGNDLTGVGSLSTDDLTATGAGRVGGAIRHGQELLRTTTPRDSTTTYDPSTDLPTESYWAISVSSDNSNLNDGASNRGFKGLYYIQFSADGVSVFETETVAGFGDAHLASVDNDGVITHGTDVDISQRAEIIVSAVRMG